MRWAWVIWLLLIVASFAALESWAIHTDQTTFSRLVWETSQAWPPLPWLIGCVNGGLVVHFWWIWNPRQNKGELDAQ